MTICPRFLLLLVECRIVLHSKSGDIPPPVRGGVARAVCVKTFRIAYYASVVALL